jgi:hypothetical protein
VSIIICHLPCYTLDFGVFLGAPQAMALGAVLQINTAITGASFGNFAVEVPEGDTTFLDDLGVYAVASALAGQVSTVSFGHCTFGPQVSGLLVS